MEWLQPVFYKLGEPLGEKLEILAVCWLRWIHLCIKRIFQSFFSILLNRFNNDNHCLTHKAVCGWQMGQTAWWRVLGGCQLTAQPEEKWAVSSFIESISVSISNMMCQITSAEEWYLNKILYLKQFLQICYTKTLYLCCGRQKRS